MNSVKSFIKNNLQLILIALCGVLIISGILVIVFGGGGSDGWLRALFIVFGVVLIILGCSLLFFAAIVSNDETANYFLYDNKKKSNISIEELDFEKINKKMTYVMANLSSTAAKVWTENVFESDNEIFENDAYVPLVAYKMLYDLVDRANESVWNLYLLANKSIIASIASALEKNSDGELGKAFVYLHENAEGSYERTEKFLSDNKRYIQNKMVKYVKTNISRF